MNTAQIDPEIKHRLQVIRGMKTQTFKDLFYGEFENLRKAIQQRNTQEIRDTIEALEACAVDVCEKYDELWEELHDDN
jgi:hypothetical protein